MTGEYTQDEQDFLLWMHQHQEEMMRDDDYINKLYEYIISEEKYGIQNNLQQPAA